MEIAGYAVIQELGISAAQKWGTSTTCRLLVHLNLHNKVLFWSAEGGERFRGADPGHVPLAVRQQYDLAEHSAFAQHLVRPAGLFER